MNWTISNGMGFEGVTVLYVWITKLQSAGSTGMKFAASSNGWDLQCICTEL